MKGKSSRREIVKSAASGATDANLWKYVQTATIAWQATSKLKVEGGIFLSPIGVEQMGERDPAQADPRVAEKLPTAEQIESGT